MKFPYSVYVLNGRRFVALYNYYPDIFLNPFGTETQAHVVYSFEGKSRGIDIFEAPPDLRDLDVGRFNFKRELSKNTRTVRRLAPSDARFKDVNLETDVSEESWALIDRRYNIQAQYLPGIRALMNFARVDIVDFAQNPANQQIPPSIREVQRIIPVTQARYLDFSKTSYTSSGKQEFHPQCNLDINLDFSLGCISGFIPGEGASFNPQTGEFTGFFSNPLAECVYCYAWYQHKPFAKTLIHIDPKQLTGEIEKEKLERGRNLVMRFGKRTEAGSKFTLPELITSLEVAINTGTKGVLPTKYLEFDRYVSEPLKRSQSSVLFSMGYTKDPLNLEKGTLAHGFDNEYRMQQALRYHEDGANSIIYLLLDFAAELKQRELEIIEFAEKFGLPMQLLSLRIQSSSLAKRIREGGFPSMLGQKDLFREIPGGQDFAKFGGAYVPKTMHPFYRDLIEKSNGRVRLCHHDPFWTDCGRCFLADDIYHGSTEKVQIKKKGGNRFFGTPKRKPNLPQLFEDN